MLHLLAYIDPGSGSLIIQAVIATLVAIPFFFRRADRSHRSDGPWRRRDRARRSSPGPARPDLGPPRHDHARRSTDGRPERASGGENARRYPWWRIPLYPASFLTAFILLTWVERRPAAMAMVRPLARRGRASSLVTTLLVAAVLLDRDRAGLVVGGARPARPLVGRPPAHHAWRRSSVRDLRRGARPSGSGVLDGGARDARHVRSRRRPRRGRRHLVDAGRRLVRTCVDELTAGPLPPSRQSPAADLRTSTSSCSTPTPATGRRPGDRLRRRRRSRPALKDRGFDVVRDSHSNYLLTPLTLVLDAVDAPPGRHPEPWPRPSVRRARDWQRLRAGDRRRPRRSRRCATPATRPSPSTRATPMPSLSRVDRFIEQPLPHGARARPDEQHAGRPAIEAARAGDAGRSRPAAGSRTSFATAERIAAEASRSAAARLRPRPGPASAVGLRGRRQPPRPESCRSSASLRCRPAGGARRRARPGIAHRRPDDVRPSITSWPPRPDPAVIVVMSDHGPAAGFSTVATRSLRTPTETMASNFMAARTPGHPGLIGDHLTPVNLFPVLLRRVSRTR